jgi:hypothetical protein
MTGIRGFSLKYPLFFLKKIKQLGRLAASLVLLVIPANAGTQRLCTVDVA